MKDFVSRYRHLSKRSAASNRYLREVRRFPSISAEQEASLLRATRQGDEQARQELIEAHLRFVVLVAKESGYPHVPLEDLISEGNLGLMRAIETFDIDSGHRLLTYAQWWIRNNMQQFSERFVAFSAGPPAQNVTWTAFKTTYDALSQALQREPDEIEIAEALEASLPDVHRYLLRKLAVVPLNAPLDSTPGAVSPGGNTFRGATSITPQGAFALTIPDWCEELSASAPAVEQEMQTAHEKYLADVLLGHLTDEQRYVIEAHYGLNNQVPRSLKAIGESISLCVSRAQQLEQSGLVKLRMECRKQ